MPVAHRLKPAVELLRLCCLAKALEDECMFAHLGRPFGNTFGICRNSIGPRLLGGQAIPEAALDVADQPIGLGNPEAIIAGICSLDRLGHFQSAPRVGEGFVTRAVPQRYSRTHYPTVAKSGSPSRGRTVAQQQSGDNIVGSVSLGNRFVAVSTAEQNVR